MIRLLNPLLLLVCLLLLGNLLYSRAHAPPHARARNFAARAAGASAWAHGEADTHRSNDPEFGQLLYSSNCTACHGQRGHGMPRQGANLRESKFIAEQDDASLIAFLRQGRTPADPTSLMGLLMPARGGNRSLDDAALSDVVAFLREIQNEARQEASATASATGESANENGHPTTQPVAGIAH